MPQARFWIAMASENSARAQPNSVGDGDLEHPELARMAKADHQDDGARRSGRG
jgi:hypothetical protein